MRTMDTFIHAPAENAAPRVAILMGTFNGQRFLPKQLDSIRQQTHTNWELHISDDGSTDDTPNTIKAASLKWPDCRVSLRSGPQKGFVTNFLSLACDNNIQADYYAFSDQDDVWELDKLERALRWLQTVPADKPAMYCSRTRLIDESEQAIGLSPLFKRAPSFKNALVQSIAGANTMVFNGAARDLLMKAGYEIPIVSHDWWVYLVVTGCGGEVFYDSSPSLGYRQHGKNLVGSNVGWAARYRRIIASFNGRFTVWNDINLCALTALHSHLSKESKSTFTNFAQLRRTPSITRLSGILQSGLYRQTLQGNISLIVAALLGKI